MARPGRLELPTLCLEGRRSFRLSYGRVACNWLTVLRLRPLSQRATEPPRPHYGQSTDALLQRNWLFTFTWQEQFVNCSRVADDPGVIGQQVIVLSVLSEGPFAAG